jgi:cellulose biosynthesis protein BcsQ
MKVITCFSYKGGAARTTAAANISAALASIREGVGSIQRPLGRKVALIDLDVFSAGTHRLFEIKSEDIQMHNPSIQDYLREQMTPSDYVTAGGIQLSHPLMSGFRLSRGAAGNCHEGFTLFPAKPMPDERFFVQKQHENVLIELMVELERKSRGFDYVVLDGESGSRQMADIAIRLADVVLVFFRLTWQHIEGTLNTCKEDFQKRGLKRPFYLVPTCVPLVGDRDGVYLPEAEGLDELKYYTTAIPDADLNKYAGEFAEADGKPGPGYLWAGKSTGGERVCIHESLCLKGVERVVVYDDRAKRDRAAADYYQIAAEIDRLHPPAG